MDLYERLQIDHHAYIPLAHQLKQQLTWLIASGELQPGDRLPPVRELAGHLAINLHTVRQAYLLLEREGLVESRRGRGTHVLALDPGRMLQAGSALRSHTVGVILPSLFNPFYHAFLGGVKQIADENQALLFMCITQDDPAEAWRYFAQLTARQVDGILIVSHDIDEIFPQGPERPTAVVSPLPLVTVDWPLCRGYCVLVDLENVGYQGCRHLLEHGHRRIGLITFAGEAANVLPIEAGYRRALEEAGHVADAGLVARVHGFDIRSGADGARRLLAAPQPPTAIFAIADLLAYGAMVAIKEAGLTIPQDIALVGFNDTPMAGLVDPPLTTVAAPGEKAGIAAMKTLQRLIAGERPARKRQMLPTTLVVRQSCGCSG